MKKTTMTLAFAATLASGVVGATTVTWIGGDQSAVDSSLEVAENWDPAQPMSNSLGNGYDFLIDQDGAKATMKHANTGFSISGAVTIGAASNPDVEVEFTGTRNVNVGGVNGPHNSSPAALRIGGVFTALGNKTKITINRGFALVMRSAYNPSVNYAQISPEVEFAGEGIVNFGDGSRLVPANDYGDLWVQLGQESGSRVPYVLSGNLTAKRLEAFQGGTSGIGGLSELDLAGFTLTVDELAFGTLDNRTGDGNPGDQSSFGAVKFNGGTLALAGDLEFRGNPDGTANWVGSQVDFSNDHYLTTGQKGGRLEIGGSFNAKSRSNADWFLNDLTVVFTGDGTEVQEFEALQTDVGDTIDCLSSGYAFGTIKINAGASAKLVDYFDNDRTSVSGEAVYTRRLEIEAGATLDLNGIHLYVLKEPVVNGMVVNGTVTRLHVAGVFDELEYVLGESGTATTGTKGNWVGPMAVGDYDGDGKLELAVVQMDEDNACADSCLYMLKYDGSAVTTAFEPILDTQLFQSQSSPSQMRFADLGDGNGTRLIYTSTGYSDVRALKSDGTYEALAASASYGNANFILADINKDGVKEIVTAYRDGATANLKVFSPQTKATVWTKLLSSDANIVSRVGVADVDGDRRLEVLALTKAASSSATSSYKLHVFNADGTENRVLELGFVRNEAVGQITALDVTGNGVNEIVVVETTCDNRQNSPYGNSQGGLFIVDSQTGATLFSVYASEADWTVSHATAQFLDVDGDRVPEILYGNKIYKGTVTGGTPSFEVVDTLPLPAGSLFCFTLAPALADLTGDGVPEIVYGCTMSPLNDNRTARQIMAYDPVSKSVLSGFPRVLFSTQTGSDSDEWRAGLCQHWYSAAIVVADLDGDGKWEIVVGLGTPKAGQTTRASLNFIKTPYSVALPEGRTEKDMGAWSLGRDDAMTFSYPIPKRLGLAIIVR